MNALNLLREDHERVLSLFEKVEDQGPRAVKTKRKLMTQIAEALRVHTQLEEEIFYPAVREEKDLEGDVKEDLEEHHLVKVLLDELDGMDPDDEQYDAKVHVLKENVSHHIESEEEELFPELQDLWDDDRLDALGSRMARRMKELQGSGRQEMRTP